MCKCFLLLTLYFQGCSCINVDNKAVGEFISIKVYDQLKSQARSQFKDELENNPSYRYEEYERDLIELRKTSPSFDKREMISFGDIGISNKGSVGIDIKGNDKEDYYDYGIISTKKNKPLRARTSININRFKLKIEFGDYSLVGSTRFDGTWETQFQWKIYW